jgi:hypothetical protein
MRCYLMSAVLVAVGLAPTAVAQGAATPHHARVYVSQACGNEEVKPTRVQLDCPGVTGPYEATIIRYRGYNTATATASMTTPACVILSPGETLRELAAEATHTYCAGVSIIELGQNPDERLINVPGTIRFSHIVRCRGPRGRTRLFYGDTRFTRDREPWPGYFGGSPNGLITTNQTPHSKYKCPHV